MNSLAVQFNKEPLWLPDSESGQRMKIFVNTIEKKYNLKFSDYWHFHKWTVENIAEIWAEIGDFFGIISSKPYDEIIDLSVSMEKSPKWFEGAKLNFAENLLKFRDTHTALIITGEDSKIERLSYKQLYEEARIYAAALRKIGLQKGDTVACYISNRKEAFLAMLAVTSIGAIWTAVLPTLGSQAFLSSVREVQPKVLFTVDEFPQNKKIISLLNNVKEIEEGSPSLRKIIIVPSKSESKLKDISGIKNSCFLDDFLNTAQNDDGSVPEITFEQVSFSHPVFISYTPDAPKPIVHGFGVLLAGIRDIGLHMDAQRNNIYLCVPSPGSVAWNVSTYSLFLGCTTVVFEGNPYFLSPTYIWDLIDDLKISDLFMQPFLCDGMEAYHFLPTKKHHLTSLKVIRFGGALILPHNYEFVQKWKEGVRICAQFGSTEIMGICLESDSTLPYYPEEVPAPCLGVSIECLDDEGNALLGEMGDFVITKPMPSFPLGYWEDKKEDLFREKYFSKYPGKFLFGDLIIINPITKGIIVCGRSDTTGKNQGYRIGSSDIYNVLKMFPEIKDSLYVVQYSKERSERIVLFLQMEKKNSLREDLIQNIRKSISEKFTPAYVPEVILEVPDIPYTAAGKKCEIIVKKIINKMAHNPNIVVNPECLNFYDNILEPLKKVEDFSI